MSMYEILNELLIYLAMGVVGFLLGVIFDNKKK